MASYTTNLDLKKPAQSDKIRIADINGNMDEIDAAFGAIGDTSVATQVSDIRAGMAIVAVSNTHDAIASGEYVYVTVHDTLDDGLYVATAAIAANGTLSSSNLTAVSKGGLNALNAQIGNVIGDITGADEGITTYGKYVYSKASHTVKVYIVSRSSNNIATNSVLGVIPSGYRPSSQTALYGAISVSGGVGMYFGYVGTDGKITQPFSSSAKEVFFTGEYAI